MINLTANSTEDAGLPRLNVCLSSRTPLARNSGHVGPSTDGFQSAFDVSLTTGSASKNAVISLRINVHQMIQKDRFGYVRIRLDFAEKALKNWGFLADSDPRLHSAFGRKTLVFDRQRRQKRPNSSKSSSSLDDSA